MSCLPLFFGGQPRSQYLVEFRAGKMTQNGTTVSPVKGRKGLIFLHKAPEDSLIHFCWKDRETGVIEDDLIIFPDEVEFKKVNQCITGRVFVLKFKLNDRRLFYWSQEPEEDKDDQWVLTFNNYMKINRFSNNFGSPTGCLPPSTGATEFRGAVRNSRPKIPIKYLTEEPDPQHSPLSRLFTTLYRQSLNDPSIRSVTEQMLVPAPESTDTDLDPDFLEINEFDAMPALEYLDGFPFESANMGTLIDDLQDSDDCLTIPKDEDLNVALSSALNIDLLQPILSNKKFLRKVHIFLPASADDITKSEMGRSGSIIQELAATIESPQFKEAVTEFASALQSGNLGHLMLNYGFGSQCINAVESGDLMGFMEELQKQLFKDDTQFNDEK